MMTRRDPGSRAWGGAAFALFALGLPISGCGSPIDPGPDPGPGGGDAGLADAPVATLPPLGPGVATLTGGADPGAMDGLRGVARLNNPVNVAVDGDGSVFVADFDNNRIRRVTPDGEVSTVGAGGGVFIRPFGLALGADGTLYVQTDNNASGAAGAGALWTLRPGGDALELAVDDIGKTRGLAALPDGRVVASDVVQDVILLIDPSAGSIAEIAGSRGQAGFQDGAGTDARFDTPYDLVLIEPDAVLVADRGNHRLRRVTLAGDVTTWAGTGDAEVREGALAAAGIPQPQALALHADGAVYASSMTGHVIFRIVDGQVEIAAGSGAPGYRDAEQPAEAQFFGLEGMDAAGELLYVADGNRGDPGPYHRVRRLTLE